MQFLCKMRYKVELTLYILNLCICPATKNSAQNTQSLTAVLYLRSVSFNSGQVKRLIALAINTNGSFQNFQ